MAMDAARMLALSMRYDVWIVFVGILLDNAGLPLPGELFLLIFGALARHGEIHLATLLVVAAPAAVAGDSLAYWIGRRWGDRLLHAYCRATLGAPDCAQRAVRYYARHGAKTVLFGRFLVGIRVFLCPLAGSVGLRFPRFFLLDCAGALISPSRTRRRCPSTGRRRRPPVSSSSYSGPPRPRRRFPSTRDAYGNSAWGYL
jgi:membrane protein DedA with SNARE-associated domain